MFLIIRPRALAVKEYKKIGGKKLLLLLTTGGLADSAKFEVLGRPLRAGVRCSRGDGNDFCLQEAVEIIDRGIYVAVSGVRRIP